LISTGGVAGDDLRARIAVVTRQEEDVRARLEARVRRRAQAGIDAADPVEQRLSWVLAHLMAKRARLAR